MGFFDLFKKMSTPQQGNKQEQHNRQQICTRCKKEIVGYPATYTYAYHIAGSYCPPICKKCASSMSFSVKYNLTCDGTVFKFASIFDELIEIRVWIEKNDGGFIIKKETQYHADKSVVVRQTIVSDPRNISEVLWQIQHLCKEIKLNFNQLKTEKNLLLYIFSTEDPNVYIPKMMRTEFSQYDLKIMARVSEIKIGSCMCACSIIGESGIKIANTLFNYSRTEAIHLSQGYSFIEIIKINNSEHFLYYIDHPSKNDILGWSIYSLSPKAYNHLKYGGDLSGMRWKNEFSLLGEAYITSPTQCLPYIIAAISNNMKIITKNGETWCE